MADPTKDGGPAFPVHDMQAAAPKDNRELELFGRGMTLRDYFAAKALTGVVGNPTTNMAWGTVEIAEFCYDQADAMLKAREI